MTHTIILLASRSFFKGVDIKNLIQGTSFLDALEILFYNDYVKVDYFGLEIDNQADFIDEEMQDKIDKNIFIHIYFENEKLDYEKFNKKQILDFAVSIFKRNKDDIRISTNGCDIDIYA